MSIEAPKQNAWKTSAPVIHQVTSLEIVSFPSPVSTIPRQQDVRSFLLRPFAHQRTIHADVNGKPATTSYTYPADCGAKMNSAGVIGDKALAGKTVEQYGTVVDNDAPRYLLTDSDIQILLRWMPEGWNLEKIRAILLAEFHRTATELPTISWPDITAILNTRSPMGNDAPTERESLKGVKPAAKGASKMIHHREAVAMFPEALGKDPYKFMEKIREGAGERLRCGKRGNVYWYNQSDLELIAVRKPVSKDPSPAQIERRKRKLPSPYSADADPVALNHDRANASRRG